MIEDSPSMMRSARWAKSLQHRLPQHVIERSPLLWRIIRAEGGVMRSRTLRSIRRARGVEVGDYSYGSLVYDPASAEPGLSIGRYVSVGPGVRVIRSDHPISTASMFTGWFAPRGGHVTVGEQIYPWHETYAPLEIGHESWVGAGVVILRSCGRVGVGAVIGAGSVVTRDVPDFAIAVGNPARVLRQRLPEPMVDLLRAGQPWLLNPRAAREWYVKHESAELLLPEWRAPRDRNVG